MYHGSPTERAELRRTIMALPSKGSTSKSPMKREQPATKQNSRLSVKSKSKAKPKAQPKSKSAKQTDLAGFLQPKGGARRSGRFKKRVDYIPAEEVEEDDEFDNAMELDEDKATIQKEKDDDDEETMSSFPVVVTTYEMIIKDRVHLSNYNWGYIVVDEGHRLKNLNCKLIKEIKKYTSAGRMILTGTPLHVRILPSLR